MPIYKNRLVIAPNYQVWRYMSLEAATTMLRDSQMRYTRIDHFEDPFEGSVPKQEIDNQILLFSGEQAAEMQMEAIFLHSPSMEIPKTPYRDRWAEMTKSRRFKTRSAHASCWRWGDDSEAMWRLYCNDGGGGQGVALRSTLAKLEASVAHEEMYFSPVSYRFYHEGEVFNDEIDALMHKRKGFEYEQEVRILMFDKNHYSALWESLMLNDQVAQPVELPIHRFIDWPMKSSIDAITVSPYASEAYEAQVRCEISELAPALPVELSVLSERRYAPGF